jgi:tRNA(Ile)-lysidine synthase
MANTRKFRSNSQLESAWLAATEGFVKPGHILTVGLSGGLDSVVLLHWLQRYLSPDLYQLRALHIHHGLSPNADAWAEACGRLCERLSVPLVVDHVEVERGSADGLEAAARRARHAAFSKTGSDWLLLAHHARDQAETLLFNLLRGCGVRGAGAMRPRQGRLLRPWLAVGRDVLEDYAQGEVLTWIDDESNADIRYSRNFLRCRVFPIMRSRFPATDSRLTAATRHFAEAQELLDDLARNDLAGKPARFPIRLSLLNALSEPRARNLLAFLLRESGVLITGEDRLKEALRQFRTAAEDRHPSMTFGEYHIVRRRGQVELLLRPRPDPANVQNNESGDLS